MLLRCNIHTLKRMDKNRHHHAVSRCREEISKDKLGSAIVTMDACNIEKLSDLNMPIEGRGRYLDFKLIPPRDRDVHLVKFKL
jgi:hypothetical protein